MDSPGPGGQNIQSIKRRPEQCFAEAELTRSLRHPASPPPSDNLRYCNLAFKSADPDLQAHRGLISASAACASSRNSRASSHVSDFRCIIFFTMANKCVAAFASAFALPSSDHTIPPQSWFQYASSQTRRLAQFCERETCAVVLHQRRRGEDWHHVICGDVFSRQRG